MDEVLAALVDDSFRSTATASSNHNLPVQLTSFIGREKEITVVQQFLKGHRLVTLTGAGGCGKTRLAQQTVLGVVHNYADGARWVELAPLADPQTIPQTIAAALGVKEEPGKPLQETVTLFLRDRKLLLIMDNCEHLIAACSSIVESLLNAAPGLSVLATSREALNLAGEFSWTVPSLSLPPDDQYIDAEQLSKFESTRLFSERARVVRPNFSITMDSATSITDICRRLDGIPLAIELAAARIKLLSPPDILQRLNNRFRLLTGGSRTAIERHKTLRATIDWSYDLLSEMEKTLFNRLSVFAGGFEMEAVEKTCSFDPVRDDEILDLFSSLTDKSLVVTETTKNGSYRYHLLETLREYAREKLIETNEIETARAAHFAHFGDMSEHAYDTWLEFSPKWLQQLETEHENLRAALEWSSRKNVFGYCKMVGALVWFWYEHAHATECYHHLCAALEKHNEKDATTARLLTEKAFIDAEFQFNIDIALAEKSIAIWRELGDKKELAIALTNLLTIRLDGNIPENAEPLLDEATDIFKELGDKRQLLRANTYGCFLHVVNFNAEKALSLAEYNIQLAKEFDMTFFVYLNQHFYGDATLLTDDYINGEIRYGVALKNAVDSENWIQALYELRGVSNAVSGQRRYIKALRLSGAIDKKWSELLNYNEDDMPVKFWAFLKNKHLGSARKVVGANAFKYEEEGRNMDFEKAVAYALDFDAD
jgi:non-specific serine/threonine protein kinase